MSNFWPVTKPIYTKALVNVPRFMEKNKTIRNFFTPSAISI